MATRTSACIVQMMIPIRHRLKFLRLCLNQDGHLQIAGLVRSKKRLRRLHHKKGAKLLGKKNSMNDASMTGVESET